MIEAAREKMRATATAATTTTEPKPTPPAADWRFPLDVAKVKDEMKKRRITLYGYYVDGYRRRLVWLPAASLPYRVSREGKSQSFADLPAALEYYNAPIE
jgi:hypothetical protein